MSHYSPDYLLRQGGFIKLHYYRHSYASGFSHDSRTCSAAITKQLKCGKSISTEIGGHAMRAVLNYGCSPGLQTTTSASCMKTGTLLVNAKDEAL